MYNNGYPTARFSINDNSGAKTGTLYSPPSDGLCVPFAFVMAERGVPGAIYYGGAADLQPVLGARTFDETGPYFNTATQMIGDAMAGQGVEVMRLVDPAATTASIGLFVSITSAPIAQYLKDPSGDRILDVHGNPEPLLMSDGVTVVTAPGVVIKWSTRPLLSTEIFNALTPTTTTSGGVTTTTYPVIAGNLLSPGAYGNNQGFSLYSTGTADSTISQAINSVLYRFAPIELATNVSTTASALTDVYGATFNDVSFKSTAIYAPTATNYAFNYVLGNRYTNTTSGDTLLPYDIFVYGANIGLVGQAALAVSPELDITDPYMIDLIAGTDGSGNYYNHIAIDPASSTVVNSAVVNYASGGSDGDTSWTMFQSLVSSWLAGSDHGEFGNVMQHPMTHFYDPGFSIATKNLLFNMLDLRDNFKIDVSTQDITLPANTEAEDISTGQALLFRAQMHQESVINGVGCMRVSIWAHAAPLLSGTPYGGLVPFNYNRMIQRRNLDGGTYVKGSSGGIPNSLVTLFRKPNWVADNDTIQSLAWASCINVVRHATRTDIFYPAYRTVYTNDTSLLSDDEIVDRIIYMYKIVRQVWAIYTGVRGVPKTLYPRIQKEISDRCNSAFSADNITVTPTVFQTAADANLGYQVSVNLALAGNLPFRVADFDVDVERATN